MAITTSKKLKWLLVSLAILGADIWVGFAMIGEYITEELKSE